MKVHDRGSPFKGATLVAMFMITFAFAIVASASPPNDSTNLTAISAVDLTNDNIADAIVATPTANGFDGQASTDATATLDDENMTRPTASPPEAISMNESAYDCDIGTAASTTLSTDDMNRATYCNSGVHRLLTRTPATNTTLIAEAKPQNEFPRGVSKRLTRLDENSANPDAAIVIKI